MPGRISYIVLLCLFYAGRSLQAQQVLYSPALDDRFLFSFRVAGQAGHYYWVEEIQRKRGYKPGADPYGPDKQIRYEIFDDRLGLVNTVVPPDWSAKTVRIYLVPGPQHFDRLLLEQQDSTTRLLLTGFDPAGAQRTDPRLLDSLPFSDDGRSILLVRSADRSKILLLGFEPVPDSAPRLHALLFNSHWKLLSKRTYTHPEISQPYIQYGFEEAPMEDYETSPLKLRNAGDWLMAASSRSNHNFRIFHFSASDSGFRQSEVPLAESSTLDDLALFLEPTQQRAQLGILTHLKYQTLKRATVVRYELDSSKLEFDTSFVFNTLAGPRLQNENLVQEYLIPASTAGFVLLKEYGIDLGEPAYGNQGYLAGLQEKGEDPLLNSIVSQSLVPPEIHKNEYTRNNRLGGMRNRFSRGDLSLFFLPSHAGDSSWSGIINQQQRTLLSNSYLSYLVLPVRGRLLILYNSQFDNGDPYASSTLLNEKGEPVEGEGVVFWRMSDSFNFQAARQLSATEVWIPYNRHGRKGFALLKF